MSSLPWFSRDTFLTFLSLCFGIIVYNASTYTSLQPPLSSTIPFSLVSGTPSVSIDTTAEQQAANDCLRRFSLGLQFRTISHEDRSIIEGAEFLKMHRHIKDSYPVVHRKLHLTVIGSYTLLYRWDGSDNTLDPGLFSAHLDVVPVGQDSEKNWIHPPFSGIVDNEKIWGRGAVDDKNSVFAILEAVELLLSRDFTPKRTLILAFGHDEEVGGELGALAVKKFLKDSNIHLDFVIDEGGSIAVDIMNGLIPGQRVALIGLAEKGFATFDIKTLSAGGHGSMPPPETAIVVISNAISKIAANPMPPRITDVTRRMLRSLGPEFQNVIVRSLFANLWLLEPFVARFLTLKPSTNAIVRSTFAPTLISGGIKENVLPQSASASINVRLLTGDTLKDIEDHLRYVINDDRVLLSIRPSSFLSEASPISSTEGVIYKSIVNILRRQGNLVTPYITVGGTDTRHYLDISDEQYRIGMFTVSNESVKRIHGDNEFIDISDYLDSIRFYGLLMTNL